MKYKELRKSLKEGSPYVAHIDVADPDNGRITKVAVPYDWTVVDARQIAPEDPGDGVPYFTVVDDARAVKSVFKAMRSERMVLSPLGLGKPQSRSLDASGRDFQVAFDWHHLWRTPYQGTDLRDLDALALASAFGLDWERIQESPRSFLAPHSAEAALRISDLGSVILSGQDITVYTVMCGRRWNAVVTPQGIVFA